jgi:hypothetical protein
MPKPALPNFGSDSSQPKQILERREQETGEGRRSRLRFPELINSNRYQSPIMLSSRFGVFCEGRRTASGDHFMRIFSLRSALGHGSRGRGPLALEGEEPRIGILYVKNQGSVLSPGTTVLTESSPFSSTMMCRSAFRFLSVCTFPEGHLIVRHSIISESDKPKWTKFGVCE